MSIPSAWLQVLDFFGTPLVIEPSSGQLSSDTTMPAMAVELARHNRAYEDIASKFFEHFVQIADALNSLGGTGLGHEEDVLGCRKLYPDPAAVAEHAICQRSQSRANANSRPLRRQK
jgi:hypothetical protein